jgi:hypothetical protein
MMSARFPIGRDVRGVFAAWRVRDARGAGAARTAAFAGVAFVVAACGTSSSSVSPVSLSSSVSSSATGTAAGAAVTPAITPSSSPAGTTKLTGTAANALIAKALADTQEASSFRVEAQGVGTGTGGQTVSFDLTLVKHKGCEGMIAVSKTETFQIVETRRYVWIQASNAFYASLHLNKAAIALVADKYIKVKSTDSQITSLAKICTFSGLFGSLRNPTGTSYVATPTTYNGQPVYAISEKGKPGYAYLSNTAKPLLLKLAASKSSGAVTFAGYNETRSIAAPSDAESIDGTALGI